MKIGLWKNFCICSMPLFLLFLSGCCHILWEKDAATYRIVTQVNVTYRNGALETQRQFFEEANIRQILGYLRIADPYGKPREDPEQAQGRHFDITLVYSDGSQRLYQQRADRYMRIDGGPWKEIDPQRALILSGLLGMMSGDPAPVNDAPVPPLIRPHL